MMAVLQSGPYIKEQWKNVWQESSFRIKTYVGSVILIAILVYLPFFFKGIEKIEGAQLNDYILARLPAMDMSVLTFVLIWSMSIFILIRCIQSPAVFLVFLLSIDLLFLSRILTITLFPLNPPQGLIPLSDPIANIFYGGPEMFITKDLFYSGHTSSMFLIALCIPQKRYKQAAIGISISVGMLVLIQHIHYTIDVLAAFVFTYLIYLLGKKLAEY